VLDARGRVTSQRTYWHLEGRGRVPTAYEIVTTKLLYYPERGFELPTPIAGWYDRYQKGSRLSAVWSSFSDPRATTYASYVAQQQGREAFVDRLFDSIDETNYDRSLDPGWVHALDSVVPVLRYPCHALHMLACYVGQMAPEGRLTVTSAFQAMDELRRVQRLAYRMRQLQVAWPGFGNAARDAWQGGAAWQPLRRLLERLLVTYDFGEASVATLLVVKPAFDALFMRDFGRVAAQSGDRLLLELFGSLDQDCRWHAAWADAFVAAAVSERPENRTPIADWIGAWWPETRAALSALTAAWPVQPEDAATRLDELGSALGARWSVLGVLPNV
jgi:toluene monooxygenase system protein E